MGNQDHLVDRVHDLPRIVGGEDWCGIEDHRIGQAAGIFDEADGSGEETTGGLG